MADYYRFYNGNIFNINRICICDDDSMAVRNKVVKASGDKCCHVIFDSGARCKAQVTMELAAYSDKGIWFFVQLCQEHYEYYLQKGVVNAAKDKD